MIGKSGQPDLSIVDQSILGQAPREHKKAPYWTGLLIETGNRSGRKHVHEFATLWTADHELHDTVCLGKQGVVLTAAHVDTRMKMRTTLAYYNIASQNFLSAITLNTQAFGF
jgi:hypothetical protein